MLIFSGLSPSKVTEFVLRHANHSYVNLENIEPFLQDETVGCHKNAAPDELTELELNFRETLHFDLATAAWNASEQYLFAVEGEDCFMGAGERSFFRYRYM